MLYLHLFLSLFHNLIFSPLLIYLYVSPTADAINNAAGFGFNGYNKDGSPRWDLISNLRILDIEVKLFFYKCPFHIYRKTFPTKA